MKTFAQIFVFFCVIAAAITAEPPKDNEPASQFTLLICQNWVVIANGILSDLNTELSHTLIYFIDYIYTYQDLFPKESKQEFLDAIHPEWTNLNETLVTVYNVAKYKIARKFNLNLSQTEELLQKPDNFKLPFSCIRYILKKMVDSYTDTINQINLSVELLTQIHGE